MLTKMNLVYKIRDRVGAAGLQPCGGRGVTQGLQPCAESVRVQQGFSPALN